jgi:flavin reductase (DIM6/NTAB) family NADH-FMN oxidoreductase RutF
LAPTTASALFERVEREVWIVTAAHGDRRGGLVATFVNPASIAPKMPRVVAGIAKTHETSKLINSSGAFALHLIDESQLDLVWRFGLVSSRDADKFDALEWTKAETGSPLIRDALAWLDCRVEARFDTGDRTLYLAEVVAAALVRDEKPLSLGGLLKIAPREKLDLLREQMQADSTHDEQEIARWRAVHLKEAR